MAGFEPETREIFGPLDKLQLEPWVVAEFKDPNKLIYYPDGSAKGFYISQVVDMELPAAIPQKDILKEKLKEHRPYNKDFHSWQFRFYWRGNRNNQARNLKFGTDKLYQLYFRSPIIPP